MGFGRRDTQIGHGVLLWNLLCPKKYQKDFDQPTNAIHEYGWLELSYASFKQLKGRYQVPRQYWYAAEDTEKIFICRDGYLPFKAQALKLTQARAGAPCVRQLRLKSCDPHEVYFVYSGVCRNELTWQWQCTDIGLLSNDEAFKIVVKYVKGKCKPSFYTIIASLLQLWYQQKHWVWQNNQSIITNPRIKFYDPISNPQHRLTIQFKDKNKWCRHGGMLQLQHPIEHGWLPNGGGRDPKHLEFLGEK